MRFGELGEFAYHDEALRVERVELLLAFSREAVILFLEVVLLVEDLVDGSVQLLVDFEYVFPSVWLLLD